ncbi:hypothetical protein [Novipirellula artificiosorum]|uniref:Uncharacterized protein n=1 Tax=Novipirellula artificiosorum TaxID=2528016 RepID=A0A5C6DZE9_9BACT|nr:hypothetical protein [Novipirellula artificiosorum]TWU40831.1 hypothetical protein Poly41_16660 [Novipirellula artificiosorum]
MSLKRQRSGVAAPDIRFARRFFAARIFALAVVSLMTCSFESYFVAAGEPVSLKDPMIRQLAAPTSAVVDGKPFREAVAELAGRSDLSVWVDRAVDPSVRIHAGQVGPTVYLALKQLAATGQCVVMPIDNVVLIGRATWVDATTASLMSLRAVTRKRRSPPLQDLAWPEATTPTEALKIVFDRGKISAATIPMPHDLWPAKQWSSIDPGVATCLLLAQFERTLDPEAFPKRLVVIPMDRTRQYKVRYDVAEGRSEMVAAIRRVDREMSVRTVEAGFEITATASAHRAAIDTFLTELADDLGGPGDIDTPNVTLNLANMPADQVFHHLAGTAGRDCVIAADAATLCKQLVFYQAEKVTLRQVTDKVAEQVGVKVVWTDEQLLIDLPVK